MNKTVTISAITVALSLAWATGRADTTVYAQPLGAGTYADTSAVQNVAGDPGFAGANDSDSEAWAYFTATSTGNVNKITWYGSNADGAFAVDLFGASCFSCGLSLVGTDGNFANNLLTTGPFTGASVTKTALAGGLFSYSITLPTAVTLQAGSSYGFSVVNNYTSAPFLWAGSAGGSGTHINYVWGRHIVEPAPGNLAFTLTSTGGGVPEPAAWSLLILGFAAVGGALRGRRATPSPRSGPSPATT